MSKCSKDWTRSEVMWLGTWVEPCLAAVVGLRAGVLRTAGWEPAVSAYDKQTYNFSTHFSSHLLAYFLLTTQQSFPGLQNTRTVARAALSTDCTARSYAKTSYQIPSPQQNTFSFSTILCSIEFPEETSYPTMCHLCRSVTN